MAQWVVKKFQRAKIYFQLWVTVAKYAFAEVFVNRWTSALFLFGKVVRFGMSLFFLTLLQRTISGFAGYTTNQIIIFFLSYQILDTLSQIFYRGVYTFSWKVKSGELDFYLAKPINPLFRILTGEPDMIDILFFFPTTLVSIFFISQLAGPIHLASIFAYLLLLINGFLIATSFHIMVICLGVLTTEVDNAIMLYRDINNLARFPVTMYREPFRSVLFWLVPVGLMNTIPAQALLNLPTSQSMLLTVLVGGGFFLASLRMWAWSMKKYTSAGG